MPDATPRKEPLSKTGNKPYVALGKRYEPMSSAEGFRQSGEASWYGKQFHGRRTSSGEIYDMYAMSAAHPVLPLPTYVKVRRLDNGREVVVRVNDRGPFLHGRIIDLSYMAARKLDMVNDGTARVEIQTVTPGFDPVPEPAQPRDAYDLVYVQAGSFLMRSNAESLRSRLVSAGMIPVNVVPAQVDGRTYFRVRVGPVQPEAVTGPRLAELRLMTGSEPRVTRE